MEISIEQLYERLGISAEELREFCVRSHIAELTLFGSVLRQDFRVDSDIDVLVLFEPNFEMGLLEFFALEEQLADLWKRKVDLIEKETIEKDHNWIRRREILGNMRVIYESRRILSA